MALCPTSLRSAPLPPMEAKSRSMPFLAQSWSCCFCKLLGKSYVVRKNTYPNFSLVLQVVVAYQFVAATNFKEFLDGILFLLTCFQVSYPFLVMISSTSSRVDLNTSPTCSTSTKIILISTCFKAFQFCFYAFVVKFVSVTFTLSNGIDLSMGTSAPSTSSEKKSTVGFPMERRMACRG